MHAYRFCPFCGNEYSVDQLPEQHKFCHSCNKWVFENLKATGSAVIIQDNKLLLVQRGIEPAKGKWDVPGGFSEPDEHPQETVAREVREELGVECEVGELFAVFSPVPYVYQGNLQMNCDLYYFATLKSMNIQASDDAAAFQWFPLSNLPAEEEMAFSSTKKLVRILRKQQNHF